MKPSIPKGTRDFSPQEMVKRNYIFDTIRSVFKLYGYLPIETPAMERIETLMGKYGEEGDKLIFKIIDNGIFTDEVEQRDISELTDDILNRMLDDEEVKEVYEESLFADKLNKKEFIKEKIKEYLTLKLGKALRYDLTVPFARYVVQHQNEIAFPFKRYQIQPVWRADKPQKGRYREFYQCDADVIGSDSLLNEVELIQIINDVFTKLDIPVIIKLNNRKILQGIAEMMGTPDKMVDIAIAIDKVDKIGMDGVERELRDRGFNDEQVMRLVSLMLVKSQDRMPRKLQLNNLITIKETLINEREERTRFDLGYLKNHADYGESENVKKGLNELERILDSVGEASKLIEFDISLARGLNYYTGSIIEVKIDPKSNSKFGSSICGGGRYDDLTSLFGPVQGFEKLSGVGVSFGADRIYDVLEELGKFPADVTTSTKVMFVNFGEAEAVHCLGLVAELRKAGVSAELYPDAAKFKKQMGYADDKKIAYVVFVGADEIKKGVVKLKNMKSGEEKEIPSTELVKNIL